MQTRKIVWFLLGILFVTLTLAVIFGNRPVTTVRDSLSISNQNSNSPSKTPRWLSNLQGSSTVAALGWRSVISSGGFGASCPITTAKLAVFDFSATTTLLIDHVDCMSSPTNFFLDGNHIYNVNSQSDIYNNRQYPIADYWLLDKNTSAESIMDSLIASLPTTYEREHCLAIAKPKEQIDPSSNNTFFEIVPDDALYNLTNKLHPDQIVSYCGEYGLTNGLQFFEATGNVLLFVRAGQSVQPFDIANFRVATSTGN